MTGPRLSFVGRSRVRARRLLARLLRAVPGRTVDWAHRHWITDDGRTDPRWAPVARLLFHRPLHQTVVTVPGSGGIRLHVVGARLERTLYWFGEQGYEPGEAAWWRLLCSRATAVLEIGSNIGWYTTVGAAAAPVGGYLAVEANPEAARATRRNLELNGLGHGAVLTAAAVGQGAPSSLYLALPDQESFSAAPTGSYLRGHTEGTADRAARRSLTVPTLSARHLITGRDLVKLDVEGAEAGILESALDIILRDRPILLVERMPDTPRLDRVLEQLVGGGYLVLRLGTQLQPAGPRPPVDEHYDVLLVPAERGAVPVHLGDLR